MMMIGGSKRRAKQLAMKMGKANAALSKQTTVVARREEVGTSGLNMEKDASREADEDAAAGDDRGVL